MKEKEAEIIVYFDSDGRALRVTTMDGEPLTPKDYGPKEEKRIDEDGMLATKNWCCWKKIGGKWVCVPC